MKIMLNSSMTLMKMMKMMMMIKMVMMATYLWAKRITLTMNKTNLILKTIKPPLKENLLIKIIIKERMILNLQILKSLKTPITETTKKVSKNLNHLSQMISQKKIIKIIKEKKLNSSTNKKQKQIIIINHFYLNFEKIKFLKNLSFYKKKHIKLLIKFFL